MQKKTVLFVVDFGLNSPNSLGQMLRNIVTNRFFNDYKKVIFVCSDEFIYFKEYTTDDAVEIRASNNTDGDFILKQCKLKILIFKILKSIKFIRKHFSGMLHTIIMTSNLKLLERKYKFKYALYMTFSPNLYSVFSKIPFSYYLYDTYLERPGISAKAIKREKRIIKKSINYYLPPFFFKKYKETYPNFQNIKSIPLPLYPKRETVINIIKKTKQQNQKEFVYFGQLQKFRNIEEVALLFKKLNYILDIFSWERPIKSESLRYNDVVFDNLYYESIYLSKYVVVLDNNEPYNHYMPSKLYELIAFCKPIIVFGKNKKSATIDFLKKYPYFCYFDLRDKDLCSKFKKFIIENKFKNNCFSERTYEKYNKKYSIDKIARHLSDDIEFYCNKMPVTTLE